MSRYFPRARVEDKDGWAISPGNPYMTIAPQADERPEYVDVPDHLASPTGILNADGEMIMRAPRPVGFGGGGEW